ncbi:unnamed protein product, partial [Urochloa humidicola]
YLSELRVAVFYGGVHIKNHKDLLKNECPHIVVGTPGRILALARDKDLPLKNVRHFILDECDKMLESLDMRRDVQEIFKMTPHDKQVMMFSATLSKEIRPVCKKFMQDVMFYGPTLLNCTSSSVPPCFWRLCMYDMRDCGFTIQLKGLLVAF